MGSDLARLGPPALNDLPPFRNVEPGPPDSLPSLAQLGCPVPPPAIAPPAPSSWTAVNHPPPQPASSSASSHRDIDSFPDRAPDHDTDRGAPSVPSVPSSTAANASALQQPSTTTQHAHIRPNSTSHLGRRVHCAKLAPKGPIAPSRQDSAASESPSSQVSAERSPEASDVSVCGVSASPALVDPLVQSPVLVPSLGSSRHARTAAHPLANPRPPLDPPRHSQHAPPQDKSHHHPASTQLPSPGSDHRPAKPLARGRRQKQPLLQKEPPLPALVPPALQKPPTRSRRRPRSVRTADGQTLLGENPPVATETMAEMAPPLVPSREGHFPGSVDSATHKTPASLFGFARPVAHVPETQPAVPRSADTASVGSSDPAAVNGYPKLTTNGEPPAEVSRVRADKSPSLHGDRASPATSSTDEPPRCHICNEVYQPPPMDLGKVVAGMRGGTAQSLDDYNQTMETFTNMIRERNRHPDSDFSQWRERHRHDSDSSGGLLGRVTETEPQGDGFHSHKRKRLPDSDDQPDHEGYYAYQPSSGAPVFVTRPIAALFPGDGVPRMPYVPPPETNHNMWYIPSEEPRKRTRHRPEPDAAPSEAPLRPGASRPEAKERDDSVVPPRRKSSGAAPLDKILHS